MKNKIVSFALLVGMGVQILPVSAAFTDVDSDFQQKLTSLEALHVISSNGAGTFRPSESLNRAEAVTMILRSSQVFDEKKLSTQTLNFSDIQQGSWYIPFVKGAVKFGIIKGYKDGTVRLEKGVSKVELLTMLQRMDHALLGSKNQTLSPVAFMDVATSDWFYDAVVWSQTFMPTATKSFEPHALLTRKDAAEILYAYVTKKGVQTKNSFGVLTRSENQAMDQKAQSNQGVVAPTSGQNSASSTVIGSGEADKMIMPPYDAQTQLTFTFSGAKMQDIPASVALYKVVPTEPRSGNDSFLSSLPEKFQSFVSTHGGTMTLQNITFTDGETNGYQYFLDLVGGTYSVYEDWSRKVLPANPVYELSDMPNITKMVAMARNFLESKGVSLEDYGTGEVDMSWKMYVPMAAEKVSYPVYYTVNFPLMVDGKKVISEWGYTDGAITVGMDESVHKVTSLYGTLSKEKVASQYDAKTWDEILADALKGGLHMPYAPYYYATDTGSSSSSSGTEMATPKTLPVTLTKAEEVMLLVRQYDTNAPYTNANEYYVPAVLFTGMYPQDQTQSYGPEEVKVVVPMVKSEFFPMPTSPIYYMKAEPAAAATTLK